MKRVRYIDRLRVECNFGSKYFDNITKAKLYFDGKVAEKQEVELWLVRYLCFRKGVKVIQKLLDCSTSFQPIFFD